MLTLISQTRQLNHLVEDLHDMVQADSYQLVFEKKEIDMIPLVELADELFEPLAQEDGLALHTSTPEQTPILSGDRYRLIQALQSLLANGLRHAHGRVDLRPWQEGETACMEVAEVIVEASGGRIAAASEGVGMGTAVRFELPIFSRLEDS